MGLKGKGGGMNFQMDPVTLFAMGVIVLLLLCCCGLLCYFVVWGWIKGVLTNCSWLNACKGPCLDCEQKCGWGCVYPL